MTGEQKMIAIVITVMFLAMLAHEILAGPEGRCRDACGGSDRVASVTATECVCR